MPPKPRPRGPQAGGRKTLPPRGRARRTASVELSGHLEKISEMLGEQPTQMPSAIQAELAAIMERNLAGAWTKNDVQRARQLAARFTGK